jgi:hypothetical protein
MAEEKKRGFHAFEDRVHQIEEEDRQRESPSQGPTKDARIERGAPRPPGEESPRTRE